MTCQQQRPTLNSQYNTDPCGEWLPTWWQVPLQGATICFYWEWHSRYGFVFPAWTIYSSTAIQRLTECLIYWHGIPHHLWSRNTLSAKEVWRWVHDIGIHWSYYISYHQEAVSLIECCNGLLKSSKVAAWEVVPCKLGLFSRMQHIHYTNSY